MSKIGVLLLNIGSPVSYSVQDVKTYLSEFLMDKDVINLPFPLRWMLVKGLIVPKRAPFSAENYKKVWLEGEGSPLTVYTDRFAKGLQEALGERFLVRVGMRYSKPRILDALKEFKENSIDHVLAVPLFPQYADATTGSSLQETKRLIEELNHTVKLTEVKPFYNAISFIENSARVIQSTIVEPVDHYLFSYHGLPESHLKRNKGCLATPDCCIQPEACAKNCYRAHCIATTKSIADYIGLESGSYSISYQSRLGRAEWIKPSTEDTIRGLAKSGVKRLAVVCPSFVADCIETLEEIGMGGEELFHQNGGEKFILIPCLNSDLKWTQDFATYLEKSVL